MKCTHCKTDITELAYSSDVLIIGEDVEVGTWDLENGVLGQEGFEGHIESTGIIVNRKQIKYCCPFCFGELDVSSSSFQEMCKRSGLVLPPVFLSGDYDAE